MTFKHNGSYRNRFFDVHIEVEFISPSGTKHSINGFYYDNDLWKVRFRPDKPGVWNYTFDFEGNGGFSKKGAGTFECKARDAEGPVLRDPDNPFQWIFANRMPFFPIGIQDCVGVRGVALKDSWLDGDMTRTPGHNRQASRKEYFSIYGKAGFNLYRFSQQNCSFRLYGDLDHYRVAEGIATDKLLSLARENGFRVMFGFFGYHDLKPGNRLIRGFQRILHHMLGKQPVGLGNIKKEKRFIDYCIARWGVYTDFWELLNERKASDEWLTLMANYVHSTDPTHKPVSTSWEKPHLKAIDINSPHWYESESELQSDLRVKQQAEKWKQWGKPVIVGEQGNSGMNWDPLSALRMRIRTWTALFQEISLVFWNTSWSKFGMHYGVPKPGHASNIYLGPEERRYIRVLRDFSSKLDADVRMFPIEVSLPNKVRAYGLLSETVAAVYLHHFENHTEFICNLNMSLNLLFFNDPNAKLIGEWVSPSNGKVIKRLKLEMGQETMEVPSFNIDLALLITPIPT